MPDITMCANSECPLSWNCWRFNAPPNGYKDHSGNFINRQAYADFKPDADGKCGYYWDMDTVIPQNDKP
jgi:hypothetical protein